MKPVRMIRSALVCLAFTTQLGAQSPARLRALFFQRDYEGGYRAGLSAVAPDAAPDVRAWFVANEARYGLVDEARIAADSIARQSPWRDFARVVALCESSDRRLAIPIGRLLMAKYPGQPDFVWAYAYALLENGRFAEVVSTLDSARRRGVSLDAELGALEGNALAMLAQGPDGDSTLRVRARAAFAEARQRDSMNVDVYYFEGAHLTEGPGDSVSVARLARAAALSPFASSLHEEYWDALLRLRHGDDSARAVVASDIRAILDSRDAYPGALYNAADGYATIGSSARSYELQERILSDYPSSLDADYVAMDRIRALLDSIFKKTVADSAVAVRRSRALLTAFVERPGHHERSTLGFAYLELFASAYPDTTVPSAAVVQAVRGMARYDRLNPQWTHSIAPVALADRRIALSYAERLARTGEPILRRYYSENSSFINQRERAQQLASALSRQHDALGWVYFNQGRLAEAGRALAEARQLDRMNPLPYYHMGRLAEARGQVEKAQSRYAKGYQLELTHRNGGTWSGEALRRLYQARHGSDQGFDAYLDTLRERDRRERHAAIAASRVAHPVLVPRFALNQLGGRQWSSDSLRGKVVVVHFWGTWCGWCVAELPDFERWYESIRNDTSVVVLTIDYVDVDRRAVQRFTEQHHLLFPVLLDDGYVDKVKVQAFPTTWFLDRTGHLAFSRKGLSEALGEEFGWRIDMLRN